MKNLLFPIALFLILAFANCETDKNNIDNQNLKLKKGLLINSSVMFEKLDYQLIVNDDYENVITIEGDSLIIDFNHIELIGTDDFTKPDEFKGIAIYIKNSSFITIKNLNVSGYRIALQADSVQGLTIDNCSFSYNYRADSSAIFDINKVKAGAITLNNCGNVDILNSIISHNQNGIMLNTTILNKLKNSQIQFNSKVGLFGVKSGFGNIERNQIDWNLEAGIMDIMDIHIHYITHNSLTHNGFVFISIPMFSMDNDFTASTINFEIQENQNLDSIPKINPKYPKGEAYKLLTKYGVYDFEYPAIFLRTVNENEYVFAMFGPSIGNWKFVNSENVASANLKTGTFPATFIIEKENPEKPFSLEFEFIGERFRDEFGVWNEKGKIYTFGMY
jgi:hypothetical protein